jgi:hypothetical protein
MTRTRHTEFLRIRCSAAVVLGAAALLLVGAGSALAVPGPSGRGSAAVAQYGEAPPAAPTPGSSSTTPGAPPATSAPSEPPTLAPPATTQNGPKSSEVEDRREAPGASHRTPTAGTPREVVKRVESGADAGQLPLTGMAIVPVLGVGLLLLLAGTLLRRRAQTVA